MSRAIVKKLSETKTGLNNRVSINGVSCTNNQAYTKAKNGYVEGYHGVRNSNGVKFIRSNPDGFKKNNIEK